METIDVEHRVFRRALVDWEAECRLGGAWVVGSVRDASAGGVFFTPDSDLLGVAEIDETLGIRFFEPGDPLLITYRVRPGGTALRRAATVRWLGFSPMHSLEGMGLAYDED